MSINRGIKKMWYIYTMEYYSAIKNKILPSVATWVNLKIVILSEVSQTQKKNIICYYLCMES